MKQLNMFVWQNVTDTLILTFIQVLSGLVVSKFGI